MSKLLDKNKNMFKDVGKGDSEEVDSDKQKMVNNLLRLQKQKQSLTDSLSQLDNKYVDLKDKVDRKANRLAAQMDANNGLLEQLSRLRCESTALDESIKRVETNIVENRNSVEKLIQHLNDKREQQSEAINKIDGNLDVFTQQFRQMSINSVSDENNRNYNGIEAQISDEISKLDQQIKADTQRRDSLIEEFNQLKDSPDPIPEDNTVGSEQTGFVYKWNDWPIQHRIITLELFTTENKLMIEDLEMIKKLE